MRGRGSQKKMSFATTWLRNSMYPFFFPHVSPIYLYTAFPQAKLDRGQGVAKPKQGRPRTPRKNKSNVVQVESSLRIQGDEQDHEKQTGSVKHESMQLSDGEMVETDTGENVRNTVPVASPPKDDDAMGDAAGEDEDDNQGNEEDPKAEPQGEEAIALPDSQNFRVKPQDDGMTPSDGSEHEGESSLSNEQEGNSGHNVLYLISSHLEIACLVCSC